MPDQLIVVDQSATDDAEREARAAFAAGPADFRNRCELIYLRDARIPGLNAARNKALRLAKSDIVQFLDDDVELEPDYITEILASYARNIVADAVSGTITNVGPPVRWQRIFNSVFHLGNFHDDRRDAYLKSSRDSNGPPHRVRQFGGGVMSFRTKSIQGLTFDEHVRGAAYGEDVDFCRRMAPGSVLLIEPRARLFHAKTDVGRASEHWCGECVRGWTYVFYRNWQKSPLDCLRFGWLIFGYGCIAAASSLRRRSLEPWRVFHDSLVRTRRNVVERA